MNSKILWDCHMHSDFSSDSSTPMEAMIQKGISLGLRGICFTEHLDPDYPVFEGGPSFTLDIPAYQDRLYTLREKYNGVFDLRFGIELGLQPHLSTYFENLTNQYPFDFVIGSSHLVQGMDPYFPGYFDTRDESVGYQQYFESILENLQTIHSFDTYGHLDYIVRWGPNKNRYYSYHQYAEIFDEILKQLVQKQIGLEINTGGFYRNLGEPNPCTDIIRRYRELGGEIITVGSDAHILENISHSFDKVVDILIGCGFRYYTVFKERKPEFVKL